DSYPPSSRNDPEKEKNYCPHHFSKVSFYQYAIHNIYMTRIKREGGNGLSRSTFSQYVKCGGIELITHPAPF
ncbi:hypothetical protein, partial [Alloprevotella tannerae]|uniref:hypothetical protein n=1 Tax=Alloprevotella tannerae TaxID=76122 RepID=UPI001ED9E2E4